MNHLLRRPLGVTFLAFFALLLSSCDMLNLDAGTPDIGDGWYLSNALGGTWTVSDTSNRIQLDGKLAYDGKSQRALSLYYLPTSVTMPLSYDVAFRIRINSYDGDAVIRVPITTMAVAFDEPEKIKKKYKSEYLLDPETLADGQWHEVVINTNRNRNDEASYYGILSIDGAEVMSYFDGDCFGFPLDGVIRPAWFLSAENGSIDFSVVDFSLTTVKE